ncbi:MAG: type II toxin-antitoxin system RelE/ParE family toxin [Ignavibacteriales bacterium]|nr:MAG: type II toxin-antitoxin system RelE/ParE family toxin [Ignavibacteriales bacterium]
MARVTWTNQAISDLQDICEFISKDSFHYAQITAQKIFLSVEKLIPYPELGRIVPELNNPEIREIVLGNYRIIYRYKNNEVEILTVYHSARLLNL